MSICCSWPLPPAAHPQAEQYRVQLEEMSKAAAVMEKANEGIDMRVEYRGYLNAEVR